MGQSRLAAASQLSARARVLPVDAETIEAVAELRNQCRLAGHGLHQRAHNADLWIAATALRWSSIPLVAHDPRELRKGIGGNDPHECRHTFATLMVAAGVDAKALPTFMGHSSVRVTLDRYGHLFPGSEQEAADLLDACVADAAARARAAEIEACGKSAGKTTPAESGSERP
jgi:integrase